ncbi:MAG: hypothetical protein Q4E65_01455 [Clostridia bacterium]|nr:hypothetical protein [Clostridia bacterium]
MKRILLSLLTAVLTVCFCACQTQQTVATVPAATASVVMPSAAPTSAPSPTPAFSINPVSAFYTAYRQYADAPLATYYEMLAAKGDIASIDAGMALETHCAAINKARVSIGRLSQSGGTYADTLLGAATGSGTLRTDRNDAELYVFRFSYGDTTLLQGTLRENCLFFSLHTTTVQEVTANEFDPETGESVDTVTQETILGDTLCADVLYQEQSGGWLSCHYDDTLVSVLRLSKDGVVFHASAPDDSFPPLAQADAATLLALASTLITAEDAALTYSVQNHP